MSSLDSLYVTRVNSEVHGLLARLRDLNAHVSLLSKIGSGSSIEARELLRCATESKRIAIQLHHQLETVADMAHAVTRRGLGQGYGSFQSNFNGIRRRIAAEFVILDVSIRKLDVAVSERINEPGRWGDAAAPSAVSDVIGFIGQILDLWRLQRVNRKIES